MEKEKDYNYYNRFFTENKSFHTDYKNSFYYVHWTQVIVFLKKIVASNVLEVGCGTGQLAEYLVNEGFVNYKGFDFSDKAIEIAKSKVNTCFFVANALEKQSFHHDYDTIICLEVLEHIKNDLILIENIKKGSNIIFSVPNFDAPSHVRWFTSERQIKRRYYRTIDIQEIIRIGNIYICKGVVTDFKPTFFQKFLASREKVDIQSFSKRIKHRIKNTFKIK